MVCFVSVVAGNGWTLFEFCCLGLLDPYKAWAVNRARLQECENGRQPEVPPGDHWGFEFVSRVIRVDRDLQQGAY